MTERTTSANSRRDEEAREALVEEVTRQREEILRLRELLIAKEAELGRTKGRLAELTAYSSRVIVAARAARAAIARLISGAGAIFRRRD